MDAPDKHRIVLTGHRDGFALWLGNEELATYPDFEGAQVGYRSGKDALAMLAACVAMAPGRGRV